MPNHIVNRLTAPTEVLAQFVGEETSERGERYPTFDFGQFIPRPDCIIREGVYLHVEMVAEIALGLIDFTDPEQMPDDPLAPGNMGKAVNVLRQSNAIRTLTEGRRMAKDLSDAEFEQVVAMMRSYRQCGSLNRSDWNRKNWGTKWNAYSVEVVSPSVVEFQTAWNAPHPVIAELAKKLGIGITHEWADENTGHNVGRAIYGESGSPEEFKELSGTKDGYELAIELHREQDSWKWNGEKYEFVEDDDNV